jgi:hypothetical protein
MLFAVVLIYGCTKFVDDVILPAAPPGLVIHCYIHPGMDTVMVHVQKTHPVLSADKIDYNKLIIDDAEVIMENQQGEIFYPVYCSRRGQYVLPGSKMTIIEGETYILTIRHKDFPDAVAQATVPFIHSDFEVVRVDSSSYDYSYNKNYYIETFIYDTPGVPNFYILYGYLEGDVLDEKENETREVFSKSIFYWNEFISDERLDGSAIPRNGSPYIALNHMPKRLHFQLYSIDKHFYAYRQSIFDLDNLDINPFSTPVKMYSNFSTGYGVFAGYSIYVHEVSLVLEGRE